MADRRKARGWRTTKQPPEVIGPLLREAGFIGTDSDPLTVRASFDAVGRPRRVHARYPEGWTCTMHMALDGSYTLTQSLQARVTGQTRS